MSKNSRDDLRGFEKRNSIINGVIVIRVVSSTVLSVSLLNGISQSRDLLLLSLSCEATISKRAACLKFQSKLSQLLYIGVVKERWVCRNLNLIHLLSNGTSIRFRRSVNVTSIRWARCCI